MLSPAQRHLQRATARALATSTPAKRLPDAVGQEYLLMKAKLGVDLRRLKELQSTERKIELKRELLPEYSAWARGALEVDAGVQDEVLVHIMIWRIDVGDWQGAIPVARHVLRWGLTLPERFNRTPATLIAEETAEAALNALGQDEDFPIEVLRDVALLTDREDMPDQARAKLNKAAGLQMARIAAAIEPGSDGPAGGKRAALDAAIRSLKRALQLNPNAGVKKDIQRLERELNKLAAAQTE